MHGYGVCDGGIVIDVAPLKGISVNPRPAPPFTTPGVSLNFTSDQGASKVAESFGSAEKNRRLVALKDAWDPTNFFRLNQNIRPSA